MVIKDLPPSGAWAAPPGTETPPTRAATPRARHEFQPFGEDGFTFGDLLDVINPLQHIPVVSTIYRELTGDDIAPMPRLAGGTLFGGPFGLAGAIVNMAVEDTTGKDIGGNVLAMLTGDSTEEVPPEAEFATAASGEEPAWATPTAAEEAILADEARVASVRQEWAAPTAAEEAILAEETRVMARAAPPRPETPAEAPARPGGWMAFESVAPETAVTAQAMRDAREQGSDIRAIEAQATLDSIGGGNRPKPRPAPTGAAAADGGWFTDAMLSALDSYRKNAVLMGTEKEATAR